MLFSPHRNGHILFLRIALFFSCFYLTHQNAIAIDKGAEGAKAKLTVFFGNDLLQKNPTNCSEVFPVERMTPATKKMATAALHNLFSGPSPSEREAGYRSIFSLTTSNLLKELRIRGATAYVDLIDFRQTLPGASSSCGSAEFQSQISHTLHQFPKVKRVIYAINGDPRTFYAWMGEPCDKTNGYCDPRPFGSPRKQAHSP